MKGSGGVLLPRKCLYDEAMSMLLAGRDTVGHAVSIGTFYILSNPKVYNKLVDELLQH